MAQKASHALYAEIRRSIYSTTGTWSPKHCWDQLDVTAECVPLKSQHKGYFAWD